MSKVFAIYKGDKFIDVGTVKELAKSLNVNISTIHFYNTKTYKERSKNSNDRIDMFEVDLKD